jgi:hypothetical protein
MSMTETIARSYGHTGDKVAEYVAWYNAMDKLCEASLGLDMASFADWDFAEAFEAGQSPAEAFEDFKADTLADNGMDPDDFD